MNLNWVKIVMAGPIWNLQAIVVYILPYLKPSGVIGKNLVQLGPDLLISVISSKKNMSMLWVISLSKQYAHILLAAVSGNFDTFLCLYYSARLYCSNIFIEPWSLAAWVLEENSVKIFDSLVGMIGNPNLKFKIIFDWNNSSWSKANSHWQIAWQMNSLHLGYPSHLYNGLIPKTGLIPENSSITIMRNVNLIF